MPANCRLDFSDSFRTVCPCLPAVTATRNKDFPITSKAGSNAVKIYKETKPNGEYYRVCYYLGGKRERLTFSSLEEAKTEARLKAALFARGDSAALELTGQDRPVYGRAIDAVRPYYVPLDAAAIEYAEARQILGHHSLLEAARFFQNDLQQGITGKPIPEAVTEFGEEKRSEGRASRKRMDPAGLKVEARRRTGRALSRAAAFQWMPSGVSASAAGSDNYLPQ